MNVSIEIVPRTPAHIEDELTLIKDSFHRVNTINIPDLWRFKVRSWQGCKLARPYYSNAIPHIRAIDFDLRRPLALIEELAGADLSSVLIVSGDAPRIFRRTVYPNTSIDLIKIMRRELPHLKIYAAIDPYRQNFQKEYRYSMQKCEAGADGFFTQPFFDCRLMQVYADILPETEIYWGVAPVLSERSRNYWETVNRAIFPRNFDFSMEWNRAFAKEALDFAEAHQHHIYYMPIRVDLHSYLGGIL